MEFHKQWLRSIESIHNQIAADPAAADRSLAQLWEIVVTLKRDQAALIAKIGRPNARFPDNGLHEN